MAYGSSPNNSIIRSPWRGRCHCVRHEWRGNGRGSVCVNRFRSRRSGRRLHDRSERGCRSQASNAQPYRALERSPALSGRGGRPISIASKPAQSLRQE